MNCSHYSACKLLCRMFSVYVHFFTRRRRRCSGTSINLNLPYISWMLNAVVRTLYHVFMIYYYCLFACLLKVLSWLQRFMVLVTKQIFPAVLLWRILQSTYKGMVRCVISCCVMLEQVLHFLDYILHQTCHLYHVFCSLVLV